MRKILIIIAIWICFAPLSIAQDSIAIISSNLLEDLLEGNDDDQTFDFFSLYDELQVYLQDPLNINTASREDLEGLQMLSDVQIGDILSYREQYGPFLSKYELQTIESLDIGILRALVPLITEGGERKNLSLKSILSESRSTLFLKHKYVLQDRKGFGDEGNFLGDRNHFFARYNFVSGRYVRATLTMEKDPGEEFFTGSNKNGFDYYSGFIHLRDIHPRIANLNIGDFSVSMGQGLISHNSFGGGKSSFVTNIRKGGRPIRPYGSVTEANFFRGLSGTFNLGKGLELTAFGSRKLIDGNVQSDTIIDTGFELFSSIIVDGFHRTENEIAKENQVTQTALGGIIKYRNNSFHVAANLLKTNFSLPLSNNDVLYRKFRFQGDELTNMSLDFGYRYKNFNTYGEVARSDNGGTAYVGGLLISLGRNIDLGLVHRNFSRDYQVLNANAFSESTLPINEKGTYLSLRFIPWRGITMSTYIDLWSHPWLRFQSDAPSSGREFLYKIEYNKKRNTNVYLQYRYEQKEVNASTAAIIDPLVNRYQHRLRLNVIKTLTKSLKLRNRFELATSKEEGMPTSKGYLIYQDIIYKPIGKSYSFTARYSIFDTDDFDSRIYTYENDILYEFSIPFFSDRGSRFYINWRQRLGRNFTFEFRYSRTYYDNRDEIGSGGLQIDGNVISEIKSQIKYRF